MGNKLPLLFVMVLALYGASVIAASPCDSATQPTQCAVFDSGSLPPYVNDAISAKGGIVGSGSVMVLSSGNPANAGTELSVDMGHPGCGLNPDGFDTHDCVQMSNYVPPEDDVVIALSSEWPEYYKTQYTDWMTTDALGIGTVDVSINSWDSNKVSIIPYGPQDTGVIILTSLAKSKAVNLRVADSGDHIYDTALLFVPVSWFGQQEGQNDTLLCGNGNLDPGEGCDDGNSNNGDGCSSLCLVEGENQIPEFGLIGAGLAMIGALAAYAITRRR